MNNKLSGREKSLLYFLLCFAIVVMGTYFLIIPGAKNCEALRSQRDGKEQLYTTMLATQNASSSTAKKIEDRRAEIENIQAQVFDSLDTEIGDRLILGYLRAHGLMPENVNFQIQGVTEVAPIYAIENLKNPKAEVVTVSFAVKGDIERLKEVLSDITAEGKFIVESFTYDGLSTGEAAGSETFNITLKMVKLTTEIDDPETTAVAQAADDAAANEEATEENKEPSAVPTPTPAPQPTEAPAEDAPVDNADDVATVELPENG